MVVRNFEEKYDICLQYTKRKSNMLLMQIHWDVGINLSYLAFGLTFWADTCK